MKHNEKYFKTNLRRWNELVEINAKSKFYDLDGFKLGKSSLFPIEREEIDKYWEFQALKHSVPMIFSIKAHKKKTNLLP